MAIDKTSERRGVGSAPLIPQQGRIGRIDGSAPRRDVHACVGLPVASDTALLSALFHQAWSRGGVLEPCLTLRGRRAVWRAAPSPHGRRHRRRRNRATMIKGEASSGPIVLAVHSADQDRDAALEVIVELLRKAPSRRCLPTAATGAPSCARPWPGGVCRSSSRSLKAQGDLPWVERTHGSRRRLATEVRWPARLAACRFRQGRTRGKHLMNNTKTYKNDVKLSHRSAGRCCARCRRNPQRSSGCCVRPRRRPGSGHDCGCRARRRRNPE